jgi:hypothetical protein
MNVEWLVETGFNIAPLAPPTQIVPSRSAWNGFNA